MRHYIIQYTVPDVYMDGDENPSIEEELKALEKGNLSVADLAEMANADPTIMVTYQIVDEETDNA